MSIRVDRNEAPKMELTQEGYLRGRAVVTKTGVFPYADAEGEIQGELRHPDDVFAGDSLDTLRMIPVTVDHPDGVLVNAINAAQFARGMTGENYQIDGSSVIAPITLTDRTTIEEILNAQHQELSLGYETELIPEVGTYNGLPYTFRQTKIRYNHLALVDRARVGTEARIKLDGAFVQVVDQLNQEDPHMARETQKSNVPKKDQEEEPKGQEEAKTKDQEGEESPVENPAEGKPSGVEVKMAEMMMLMKAMMEMMARMGAEDQAKEGDEEDPDAEKKMDAAINRKVKLLLDAGKVISTDGLSGAPNRDIMLAVIKYQTPDVDYSTKSDDYIQARFDALVEAIPDFDPTARDRQLRATARSKMDSVMPDVKREEVEQTVVNMWKTKGEPK